jgi:hypothetical protein
MKAMTKIVSLAASALVATASFAQAPTGAPAGATGLCNDGTYWTAASKSGACSGHKGVKQWFGARAATAAAPTPVAPPVKSTPPAPVSVPTATAAPAPGGGPGLVWVNSSSKTYHCPGDQWYGKTKSGQYMLEQQAVAKGYHPDHGKACGK